GHVRDGTEHTPHVRRVPLRAQPREVVVGGHLEVESRFLCGRGVAHEFLGAGLFGHEGVAETGHAPRVRAPPARCHRSLPNRAPHRLPAPPREGTVRSCQSQRPPVLGTCIAAPSSWTSTAPWSTPRMCTCRRGIARSTRPARPCHTWKSTAAWARTATRSWPSSSTWRVSTTTSATASPTGPRSCTAAITPRPGARCACFPGPASWYRVRMSAGGSRCWPRRRRPRVGIALGRAGVDAAAAVRVGDATRDAIAATTLGIGSIAVRTGGIGDAELRDAGYSDLVDDAAAVLAFLDTLA